MVRGMNRRHLVVFIPAALVWFLLCSEVVDANGDRRREKRLEQLEKRVARHNSDDPDRRKAAMEDEGHEITGQATAWLLVSANLSVVFSMLMKGVTRYFSLGARTKASINRLNQQQKKWLMRFHYILNPAALGMGALHFLLSSCRKSSIPEWGLICLSVMVLLGALTRFRVGPRQVHRIVYRLHTGVAGFSIVIVLLVGGHLIVD